MMATQGIPRFNNINAKAIDDPSRTFEKPGRLRYYIPAVMNVVIQRRERAGPGNCGASHAKLGDQEVMLAMATRADPTLKWILASPTHACRDLLADVADPFGLLVVYLGAVENASVAVKAIGHHLTCPAAMRLGRAVAWRASAWWRRLRPRYNAIRVYVQRGHYLADSGIRRLIWFAA